MANYKVSDTDLTSVANAIRQKGGTESSLVFPAGFVSAVGAITTGDAIDHEDLPAYVKAEALEVAKRVKAKLQSDSILLLTGSDAHQIETGSNAAVTMAGNLHAGQAMKALAYMLPFDLAAFLGDYTAGSSTTTVAEGKSHFASVNAYIDEAFRGLPQFRTVGNHDPLGYSKSQNGTALTPEELDSYVGSYNDDGVTVMGSRSAGYCYRDFASKRFRVICLNTADTSGTEGSGEVVTAAQQRWFADTLISTPEGYGILILAHHPLDWGNIMGVSHILRAYVEEQASLSIGGTAYSFTGKNKSAWVLQIHGHVHSFTVDKLHWNNGGTGVAYDVYRLACPCMNFVRTNEYGENGATEYYGIEFGTPGDTQSKTAGGAEDTAFCVYVINPSEQKVYSICYGAGYDRETYWGAVSVPVTGVTLSANSGTLHPGNTMTLTATVAPADASNKSLIWTSSNTTVATVSGGTVTALAVGTATVTVRTQDGGFTDSFTLTVEAAPKGNLMPTVGWFDNTRRKSDGTTAADTGIVSTGFIDFQTDVSYPAVIRIRGAEFRSASAWQANMVTYPPSKTGGVAASIVDGGECPSAFKNAGGSMSVSSDGQTVVVTLPRRPNTSFQYLVFNGKGSGANLDLRINEDFDD